MTDIELPDVVPARCEGDHFFEDICNACDAAQPGGPCEVCPHMPGDTLGHYARRPCRGCGSADLRAVRVRAPLTPFYSSRTGRS